jgi:hypothetical protein
MRSVTIAPFPEAVLLISSAVPALSLDSFPRMPGAPSEPAAAVSRRSASLEPDRRAGQLPQIVRQWTDKPPPRRAEAIILADSNYRAARNIKIHNILVGPACQDWQNLYPPRTDRERTAQEVQERWARVCRGSIIGGI